MVFGIVLLEAATGIVEVKARYDNAPFRGAREVNISVQIKRRMQAPIYVYYELDNFHQNVRRYVKSRSNPQLYGDTGYNRDPCSPMEAIGNQTLYPCGLVAGSFFNDTITGYSCGAKVECRNFNWTKEGINWESDSKLFHKRDLLPTETRITASGVTLPDVTDPDFINWMRPAGFNRFRKLYRIIHDHIEAGSDLIFTVNDEFAISQFGGTKSIILSTQSWIGAKNSFLGFAYLVVAILCLAFAVGFALYQHYCGRELGMRRRTSPRNAEGFTSLL